jgi:hypothetical protein
MGRPDGVAFPLMINEVHAHETTGTNKSKKQNKKSLFMPQRYNKKHTYTRNTSKKTTKN